MMPLDSVVLLHPHLESVAEPPSAFTHDIEHGPLAIELSTEKLLGAGCNGQRQVNRDERLPHPGLGGYLHQRVFDDEVFNEHRRRHAVEEFAQRVNGILRPRERQRGILQTLGDLLLLTFKVRDVAVDDLVRPVVTKRCVSASHYRTPAFSRSIARLMLAPVKAMPLSARACVTATRTTRSETSLPGPVLG